MLTELAVVLGSSDRRKSSMDIQLFIQHDAADPKAAPEDSTENLVTQAHQSAQALHGSGMIDAVENVSEGIEDKKTMVEDVLDPWEPLMMKFQVFVDVMDKVAEVSHTSGTFARIVLRVVRFIPTSRSRGLYSRRRTRCDIIYNKRKALLNVMTGSQGSDRSGCSDPGTRQ